MKHYCIYVNELINCPFCNKLHNIYYIKSHLKCKSCKKHQIIMKDDEINNKLLDLEKEINKIKSTVKYNVED
jgi:hypothetical protein